MVLAQSNPPQEQWLEGTGGKIFTRHWRSTGEPKTALVICHGLNSHSGHYGRVAKTFAASGIAVTALDLRGHGKSDGERFYVETIDDYVSDLALAIELAKSRDPGLPCFLLGHSAGGVTSVAFTLDHQNRIDGLICEDFAFRVPSPDLALSLLKGASHVAPHLHVLKLRMEDFSRDPEWVAELRADPLVNDEVQPVRTVAALARAADRFEREFARIALPVLILHGTADKVTRLDGSQQFFDEAGSTDKQLIFYEGYYHDPLNDIGKERVFADIISWIEARLGPIEKAEAVMPDVT